MRKFVKNFEHHVAGHCGSGALNDLLTYYGRDVNEPYCFGMGGGLFMVYSHHGPFGKPVMISGRGSNLERDLCRRVGATFKEKHKRNFEEFWRHVRAEIDADRPVLCLADMFYLKYLKAKDHFGVHRIVLAGYDDEAGEVYIADRELPGFQTAGIEELRLAWTSEHMPMPAGRTYFEFAPPEGDGRSPLHGLAGALEDSAAIMLEPPAPQVGVPSIRLLAKEVNDWPDIFPGDEFTKNTRLAWVYLEVGGTGGGNFRRLYAAFLDQMAKATGLASLQEAADAFAEAADAWTRIAYKFLDITKTRDLEGLDDISKWTARVADLEEGALLKIRVEVIPALPDEALS